MFTHTIHRAGQQAYLDLAGEIDIADHHRLGDIVTHAVRTRPVELSIDIGDVTFLDCATIAMLLRLQDTARDAGIRLVVNHPQGLVRRIVQTLGLLSRLTAA